MPSSHRSRFGVFEFDLSTGELLREGQRVKLAAQPAQVLRILIEAKGELVTRDALREAVWGNSVNVDFDKGLNFCVSQIRGALRDSTESPRFILTVPKRGYQFIAPLAPAESIPVPTPSRRRAIAASATLIATAGLGLLWAWNKQHNPTRIAVVRFDNETGDPSLSQLTDAITDALVSELTAATEGKLGVIGNAAVLRKPRAERDLVAIATSLETRFVVLGQLQKNTSGLQLLAHLIEMPGQFHRKVARFVPGDANAAAQRISQTFVPLLSN
jgi:DNA-binding winged helix-turn-helix (wHTH) protein/TolB-like protein